MMSKRRSRRSNSNSLFVSSRKRSKDDVSDINSEGYKETHSNSEISRDLLSLCFFALRPCIWYRILPDGLDNDNICSGFGQKWEHILPLLCNGDLLKAVVVESSIKFDMKRYNWETLCLNFVSEKGKELHSASYRRLQKTTTVVF